MLVPKLLCGIEISFTFLLQYPWIIPMYKNSEKKMNADDKKSEKKMNAVEMQSLRKICGVSLADAIRNKEIHRMAGISKNVIVRMEKNMLS